MASPGPFDPREFSGGLPHLPGVYRMLDAAGRIIYVGKARDLRKRVSSYFQKTHLSPRVEHMVAQVSGIDVTVTRSEAEALLLENNLIKAHAPRYNILFRDDKSYPYIVLAGSPWPRLGFHRGVLDKANRYFGPFANATAVRESIALLQKVFRLRTCEDTVFLNRTRPCLLHQIRRCTAPCVGLVDEAEYAADVRGAELFLQGRQDEVQRMLSERMHEAAERLEYEQAAIYRDQLQALAQVQTTQFVESASERDVDVVAAAGEGATVCVNLVMVRGGRHVGDKSLFPQNAEGYDAAAVLEAFVAQHYAQSPVPPLVVIADGPDCGALEEMLTARAGHRVRVASRVTGERRVWLEMANENALLALRQRAALHASQEGRAAALGQALDVDPLRRIECFDVSHTMGEATVASCVVYDLAAMQKSEYRRYNITGVRPGDDYAAMREVLNRRYQKVVAGEGRVPDLILIDGGTGQVNAAAAVLEELGLSGVALVGVAKGPERKPGLEELVYAGLRANLRLPADHPGLHLIQQVRDEAHRFAIEGHRARRARARTASSLEQIEGIGAKRRQRLLARFGGLRGVIAASIDDLQQVEGISRVLAEKIYRELH